MSASNVAAKSPVPFATKVNASFVPVVMSVATPLMVTVELKVLLLKVSTPAKVANVPVVGKVTLVDPVVVKVKAFDPAVAKSPAKVKVPVVQVGAPAPPDNKACPAVPTDDASKLSASE